MSFTLEIKKEILDRDFTLDEAKNFILGFVASAGYENGSKVLIKTKNEYVINQFKILMDGINKPYKITNESYLEFDVFPKGITIEHPDYFIAGTFVGSGSMSEKEAAAAHLEIQFVNNMNAVKLNKVLKDAGYNFALIQRRTKWVAYLKKRTEISDFLRSIYAFQSSFEFEEIRIQRDFKNQITRYANLDIYNQEKLAAASFEFKTMYKFITKNNLKRLFKEHELFFFDLKKTNPYDSLAELTKKYNKKYKATKTRAGLNHWIIKLRKIYDSFN